MGHSCVHACLKQLLELFPTILTESRQKQSYLREISHIQLYGKLPTAHIDEDLPVLLDLWWAGVFRSSKYPTLSLVVKACLSVFSGQYVEASFSQLNNIIDKISNCMVIEAYSGIMNVKYSLQMKTNSSRSTSSLYQRLDPERNSVDKNMCYNLRTSYASFKNCRKEENL